MEKLLIGLYRLSVYDCDLIIIIIIIIIIMVIIIIRMQAKGI